MLGIKAAIAESFERIHRSNLIGMGIVPLVFKPGENLTTHGLTGFEKFDILGIGPGLKLRQELTVKATADDGKTTEFKVICRIDTPAELDYYRHGGILEYVLRQLLAELNYRSQGTKARSFRVRNPKLRDLRAFVVKKSFATYKFRDDTTRSAGGIG